MASTPINRALGEIRGTVDDYVFRLVEGKVFIARRPRPRDHTPSEAQLEVQTRFKRGSAYTAKVFADPALKQWYVDRAEKHGISMRRLFGRVLRDYVQGPVIEELDYSGYHRHVGDRISVIATDDFDVTGVHVAIVKSDGTVLEEGPAVSDAPHWIYTAKTEAPAGIPLTLTVLALDRAGNKTPAIRELT